MPDYKSNADATMQGIAEMLGVANAGVARMQEASRPAREEAAQEKLRQFIGQQEASEQTKRQQQVQDFIDQQAKLGRKVSASAGKESFAATQSDPNIILQSGKGMASEAKTVTQLMGAKLKPLHQQLEASENTLTYLNQGNAMADKAALINEANMLAGGTGSRAIGALLAQISGDPTMGQDVQKAINWIQNSAEVKMQPAQRNALREMVLQRLPTIQQQYQDFKKQVKPTVTQLAPMHVSMGQTDNLSSTVTSGTDELIDRLNKSNLSYMQQKAQAGNPQVSRPAEFNQQPTTLQRLGSMLGIGGKQAPAPAQPQANPGQSGDTIRVRHKPSGQTGTIPSNEFDPNVYEQVQ